MDCKPAAGGSVDTVKRFTEALKWSDPWFRRLSAPAKLLWFYAVDHCDNIGLVEIDVNFVSADCGIKVSDKHIAELGERLQIIDGRKFFLPKFIAFQYGKLSVSCPAHKKVIESVAKHQLIEDSLGYHYPSARVTITLQDKDKDKDKDKKKKK